MAIIKFSGFVFLGSLSLIISGLVVDSVRIELDGLENLQTRCDFSRCPRTDPNKLNVHLVAHTHDDVGWLKTVDQYYYGLRNDIQNAGVQYILDTVVGELVWNKDRRFIYVETAFFWRWWQEQNKQMKDIVQELVQSGQLEFINGGWSMPDEATTHYNSLIDQSTWGLRRLNDTFGKCGHPRVTWQIDPFGHSREVCSLYAQMGYDALYFARQDYQDRWNRQRKKTLEHVWFGSDDLGTKADLFTGMMQMGYGPPNGLDWDLVGGEDEPVIDNPSSEEYNVPKVLREFVKLARNYSSYYATNHIMFPMGTDFNYQSARQWFKNMDKLIKMVNGQSDKTGITVHYSTPSCYTKALHETGRKWTTKSDDYFPYASDPHAYWTGYFTSRPALKRMERWANNWLQACKQLDSFTGDGRNEEAVTALREAMGVMQHHDAVAGTEKQHVANDYAKQLYQAVQKCQQVIGHAFYKLHQVKNVVFCDFINVSRCDLTENQQSFRVLLYNPLAHPIYNYTVRLPINGSFNYKITDRQLQTIPAVLVPVPEEIQKLTPQIDRKTKFLLVFRVDLKALDLGEFIVERVSLGPKAKKLKPIIINDQTVLRGRGFDLIFDEHGELVEYHRKMADKSITLPFRNYFQYYQAAVGDNKKWKHRSSGAYIFRPKPGQKTQPAARLRQAMLVIDQENYLVQEVHQRFESDSLVTYQIIRVDPFSDYVEFDFIAGPIPINDGVGKELVTRYEISTLNNNGTFWTDANGRQMLRRQWNYRPTWELKPTEPISGNYYPVNSRIAIQDPKQNIQMTVLNDRSQGGTSIETGTIELMLHRRLLYDDAFGVDEPLNEPGTDGSGLAIRVKHYLLIDTIEQSPRKHRPLAQRLFLEPIIGFSTYDLPRKTSGLVQSSSPMLATPLPEQIHLLTLEQWSHERYLLRLEHFYQKYEDPRLSQPVKVNLRNLFARWKVIEAEEMTLAANQNVLALKDRLKFDYDHDQINYRPEWSGKQNSMSNEIRLNQDSLDIELWPMEIRTFLIKVSHL